MSYTAEDLYHAVKIDELYFLATGGGITFGGGEPCLYPDFIKQFRTFCGDEWNITLETSLHVPPENVKVLFPVVNHYIVDIKDMNHEIYRKYTGKENSLPVANLKWLIEQGKVNQILVRVPLIPNYNTQKDTEKTVLALKDIGISDIEIFKYINFDKDETRKKSL